MGHRGCHSTNAPAVRNHPQRTHLPRSSPITCSNCCSITAATSLPTSTNSFEFVWGFFLLLFKPIPFCKSLKPTERGGKQPLAQFGAPDCSWPRPHCASSLHLTGSASSPKPYIPFSPVSSRAVPGRTSPHQQTPPPLLYFTDTAQGTGWKSFSRTLRHHHIHRPHRLSSAFPGHPAPAVG